VQLRQKSRSTNGWPNRLRWSDRQANSPFSMHQKKRLPSRSPFTTHGNVRGGTAAAASLSRLRREPWPATCGCGTARIRAGPTCPGKAKASSKVETPDPSTPPSTPEGARDYLVPAGSAAAMGFAPAPYPNCSAAADVGGLERYYLGGALLSRRDLRARSPAEFNASSTSR